MNFMTRKVVAKPFGFHPGVVDSAENGVASILANFQKRLALVSLFSCFPRTCAVDDRIKLQRMQGLDAWFAKHSKVSRVFIVNLCALRNLGLPCVQIAVMSTVCNRPRTAIAARLRDLGCGREKVPWNIHACALAL